MIFTSKIDRKAKKILTVNNIKEVKDLINSVFLKEYIL